MVLCIEEGKTPMIWTDGFLFFLTTEIEFTGICDVGVAFRESASRGGS